MGDKRAYEHPESLLGNLSIAERISAEASAIIFATVNPKAADDEMEFIPRVKKLYRNEQTVIYHVNDFPSPDIFPQVPVLVNTYTEVNDVPIATPLPSPAKIPRNQFMTILCRDLLSRLIVSYKNHLGAYTAYSFKDDDGSTTFELPIPDQGSITTVYRVGGAQFDNTTLNAIIAADRLATEGFFFDFSAASAAIVATLMAAADPVHGAFLAAKEWKDRRYNWWATSGLNLPVGAPGASPAYMVGGVAPTGTNPQSTTAFAGLANGILIFYWQVPPAVPSNPFVLNVYGYNEGQEYLYFTYGGITSANNNVANCSFAVVPIVLDDYYRWEIGTSGNAQASATQLATYGVLAVKTGEDFSHLMTDGVEDELNVIEQDSWIATTMLAMNGTNSQFKGGFQAGVQPARDEDWQVFVDGGDPYTEITTYRRQEVLKFEEGGYCFLKPTSEEDYELRREVEHPDRNHPNFVDPTTSLNAFYVPMRNSPKYVHVVSAPLVTNAQPPQQVQFRRDFSGEHTTNSKWRHPELSQQTEEAFRETSKVLMVMPQLYENATHDYKTRFYAMLAKAGISQGTIDSVSKWAKILWDVGSTAIPLISAAL